MERIKLHTSAALTRGAVVGLCFGLLIVRRVTALRPGRSPSLSFFLSRLAGGDHPAAPTAASCGLGTLAGVGRVWWSSRHNATPIAVGGWRQGLRDVCRRTLSACFDFGWASAWMGAPADIGSMRCLRAARDELVPPLRHLHPAKEIETPF